MTDFFDVLEQQLVAAHRRPERRRFVAVPWRATIVFAGAVAAAALVVVAVLALSSPSPQPAASSPPTQPPQTTPVNPPPPLTLAVLNGTTITGLARAVADDLTTFGYDVPNVVTNDTTNHSRVRTTVYFEPGHRSDALGVASCLHIGSDRVASMDANTRALADRAQVAVFVGADRAR
jgi:LytR cell envelope-related transcriptional attenuator